MMKKDYSKIEFKKEEYGYLSTEVIKIYGENLGTKNFKKKLKKLDLNSLRKDKNWRKDFEQLDKIKKILDNSEGVNSPILKNRIFAYLKALFRFVKDNRKDNNESQDELKNKSNLLYNLTLYNESRKKSSINWPKKYKIHYNFLFEVISNWHTCFISFTRKGLICTNHFKKFTKNSPSGKKNLVASIHYWLERNSLRNMWVDWNRLSYGDSVKEEIIDACRKSLFLIQIIETASFNAPGEENWQYFEFKEFRAQIHDSKKILKGKRKKNIENRIICITIEEGIECEFQEFADMYEYYFGKDQEKFRAHIINNFSKNHKIIKKLYQTMKAKRLNLIQDLP